MLRKFTKIKNCVWKHWNGESPIQEGESEEFVWAWGTVVCNPKFSHICVPEGKLQDVLMLQSFSCLWEWGSCSNKIAPKPVGCGDPMVLPGICGCSDTFLLCGSGDTLFVGRGGFVCQCAVRKWFGNGSWLSADAGQEQWPHVLPLPCSCHLRDKVVTITHPARWAGKEEGREESLLPESWAESLTQLDASVTPRDVGAGEIGTPNPPFPRPSISSGFAAGNGGGKTLVIP